MDMPSTLTTDNNHTADKAIDTKLRLSILWIAVMFNMIYADILGFVTPGAIEELMTGYSGTVELTQEVLFISALLLEIPIIMIVLSRVLNYRINRIANIAAGIITILFVIAGIEEQLFFKFFVAVEVLLMTIIIFYAWSWKELSLNN